MKNLFFTFLAFIMVLQVQAQDAKKLIKEATKNFARYNQDIEGNKGMLQDAIKAIDQAFEVPGTTDNADAWIAKGNIYNGIADSEMKKKLINPEYVVENAKAPMIAFDAFKMAMSKAVKSGQTKGAATGLKEVENHLANIAITSFQNGGYSDAFDNFNMALAASKLLGDSGQKSRLDDATTRTDIEFYTAISGYYGEKGDAVLPILTKLFDQGSKEAIVYEALFNIESKKDADGAMKYLEAGRKMFPENTGLLFAEINHYLAKGELNKLITKLKEAIASEPDNVSVISTTGSVYEQLYNKEKEAGNSAKASEYIALAKDYYEQALAKDPDGYDTNYSIGALYYNDAAAMTTVLNSLASDYSKEGAKKYDEASKKMLDLFEKARPYFEKSLAANAEDTNSMIALKEIYVRQGKMEDANRIKKMLEGGN